MSIFNYRKLIVYQKSKESVKRTYYLSEQFPPKETWRCVISCGGLPFPLLQI